MTTQSDSLSWRGWLARGWLVVLALLAPLKFGTVMVTGEVALFPLSGWEWLLGGWPPVLASGAAAAGLLLAVLAWPAPPGRDRDALIPGAWWLLLVVALAGLAHTTETDAAFLAVLQWGGVGCFVTAVWWTRARDPGFDRWFLAAVATGTLLAAASGWWQVLGGGLDETLAFAEAAARKAGRAMPPELMNRLAQRRAFGPFVYPNSFAAHLILTGPAALVLLWRWGAGVHPPRLSQPLLAGFGAVLVAGALWLSGSRAALVALVGGAGLVALAAGWLRWRRSWLGLGAVVVLAGAGLAAVNQGRGLETVGARLDYYRAAVRMAAARPVAGVGLGEFFPWYMRLKPPGAEETRLPHNMVLGFAAQAGVLAGVVALGCLLMPLLPLRQLARNGRMKSAVDDVGNPLLRKGGSQTLRQTCLHLCGFRRQPPLSQSWSVARGLPAESAKWNKSFGKGDAERTCERPGGAGTAEREARGEHPFSKGWPQHVLPSGRPDWGMATALGLGTLAWGLHALADFNSEIPGTVMLAAALPLLILAPASSGCSTAGQACGSARTNTDEHGRTRTNADQGGWAAPAGVTVAAVLVSLAVLAGSAWRLPGERAYQVACNVAADPGLPLSEAARLAAWAGDALPWSPYPWAMLGRLAEEQQAWAMAADAFGRAGQRTPHRAAFHDRRARALAALGDPAAAERERALARLWYPYPPPRR